MKPRWHDYLSLNFYIDYVFHFEKYDGTYDFSFKEKIKVIICRLKGHPSGPIYYTGPSGTEPDMRCKDCGEEL